MHVPRYWEKHTATARNESGNQVQAACWGWSEHSPTEARKRALQAANRLVEYLSGRGVQPNSYGYDERLPREEILEEFADESGQPHAIVTRNAYGSLILNTRDLMFIDVDFQTSRPKRSLPGFLINLLGQSPPVNPEDTVRDKVCAAAQKETGLGFRIYRTRNGYRVMVHSRPIPAASEESLRLLDAFNADPLYRRMCKNQACFRARLTPKAWRCQVAPPPSRFPFADTSQESAYRSWEQSYHHATDGYATCQYVETIGADTPDSSLVGLIDLHDKLSKASHNDPLA